ncbi:MULTISPECIES: hypothetical protein [unclassified Microbacterium]|uniref:hypothetical protein n=1 Tax=unclassified Microbacterium TaxID=2609290 RepID=UPI00097F3C14|nr:hypothetical protein [Microbacterium sp. JB110]RCS62851.1 hypothetical protein CIK77_01150 [Microbacterium sp. JB110]SJM62111.1 hypothetical protein CZ774_11085 [Frigoribacterium sp. JB110]
MTFISALVAAAEEHHGNVALETLPYGIIAAVVFALLGLVTFSYRNVANRHADKVERAHEPSSHKAGHGH